MIQRHLSRRRFFTGLSQTLAGIPMLQLLAQEGSVRLDPANPYAPRAPHFPAKAKRVVVIFCSGAISHVDTFDYKPELVRLDGKPLPGAEKLVSFQGENGNLAKPLWQFRPRGQCGKMISDLVPHIGSMADDLCFLHAMTSRSNTHGPAEIFANTGFTTEGFPSAGAWITYALGSESANLPAFVAIEDPRGQPQAAPGDWGSGFLPAAFQGTPFSASKPVEHLMAPSGVSRETDQAARDLLGRMNRDHARSYASDSSLAARIASYELAARMQLAMPEVSDLSAEPAHILKLYGADNPSDPLKTGFARNCILARRLLERGVRFVQLFNGAYASGGKLNWDGHSNLKEQYDEHGRILDQPVAGLLQDLKQRGLFNDTLVVFATEFGRMPMFQRGTIGRDHNPDGFTCWLAGAGVRGGMSHGATDAFGHVAEQDITSTYDFHATILHLLGLNHEKLTYYHNGIGRRLTDVHGNVVREVLA